jgi:hypothetical protein
VYRVQVMGYGAWGIGYRVKGYRVQGSGRVGGRG